ncbi:MAG: hypothetical protein OEZ16_04340 [Chromatiales bacterium]|nr:hypothetical protein [Chromatiales bacterium]
MKRVNVASSMMVGVMMVATGNVQADVGVGVRMSSLGAGVELGKSVTDFFTVRVGLNKYSTSQSETIDNINYDTNLDLQSTSLMLDWNPFGGSFHLTAGYLNSGNEISVAATPNGLVTVGNTTVNVNPGELVLNGKIKLGSGPYLGLGWGNVPASGLGFVLEAGVVQMGTPDVSLSYIDNTGTLGLVQADIDQEIANMKSDLNQYDTYPVIAIGISYGF